MSLDSNQEYLEFELEQAYPGLPAHAYQSIAYEALHRSTGGAGGKEWALNAARLALLDMQREKIKREDGGKELEDYFAE